MPLTGNLLHYPAYTMQNKTFGFFGYFGLDYSIMKYGLRRFEQFIMSTARDKREKIKDTRSD